jgi:hypothetical protein
MRTHLLTPGAKMPESGMSSSAACRMNKGHVVEVSRSRKYVDCMKCLQIPVAEYESEISEDPEQAEVTIVHFGEDLDMIEPDSRAWCRKKIVSINESYATPVREDVTCSRCKSKMSR